MIQAILTDIEGTTSSLSFVKDVLFPYSRVHMADFVRAQAHAPAVRTQLDEVSRLAGRALTNEEASAQLIAWIDADKKITPLKALQGLIWEAGYKQGDYQGHVRGCRAPTARAGSNGGSNCTYFPRFGTGAETALRPHRRG